jgi:hypothetical protein
MDAIQLEITKLKWRILLLQGLLAKTYIAAFGALTDESQQALHRRLLTEFDRAKEQKYLFLSASGVPNDQRFSLAEAFEEVVEEMKASLNSMFTG